jgi:hypothetical protein
MVHALYITQRRADELEAHVSDLEASRSQMLSASMIAPAPAAFHTPTRRFTPQEPPSTIQTVPSASVVTLRAPPPVPVFHSAPHSQFGGMVPWWRCRFTVSSGDLSEWVLMCAVPAGMIQLGHGGGWINVGPAPSPASSFPVMHSTSQPVLPRPPTTLTHPSPQPSRHSLQSPGVVEKPQRSHRHAV